MNICPQCTALIEKDQGCPQMRCTICHFEFCWVCGTESDNWFHKIQFGRSVFCSSFHLYILNSNSTSCNRMPLIVARFFFFLTFLVFPILFYLILTCLGPFIILGKIVDNVFKRRLVNQYCKTKSLGCFICIAMVP